MLTVLHSRQRDEQLAPASGPGISRRDGRYGFRPRDGQLAVMGVHADVLGRIVRPIDAVTHIGFGCQRLESVQESRRDVEMPKSVVVEHKRLIHTESRRTSSDIDDDVVHSTPRAPDEFGFAAAGAAVHAAQDSLSRTRLGVLQEARRYPRAQIFVEDLGIESPGEESAIVAVRLVDEQQDVGELRLLDPHKDILT